MLITDDGIDFVNSKCEMARIFALERFSFDAMVCLLPITGIVEYIGRNTIVSFVKKNDIDLVAAELGFEEKKKIE